MQILQNVHVARHLAREHQASLRRVTFMIGRGRDGSGIRRWLGHRLVRTGTWLANEPPMQPSRAR